MTEAEKDLRRELRSLRDGERLEQLAFPGRGSLEVEDELRQRIAAKGRITFAEFMEVALYLPRFGYYAADLRSARSGDYVTSPEVHPAFGALLGRALICLWRALGAPPNFQVLEPGAGPGRLFRDALSQIERESPDCFRSLHYFLSDVGEAALAHQHELLGQHEARGKVAWRKPEDRTPVSGGILAHEVVDALPVHRVVMRQGRLRELYVSARGQGFFEEEGEPSRPELRRHLEETGVSLGEGEQTEVGLAAREWMQQQAARLERGFLLVIDYGRAAEELASLPSTSAEKSEQARGSVRSYYRHALSESPYLRPGYQDITASVDFTALARAGTEAGLQTIALLRQEDFLLRLGMGRWRERLKKMKLESGVRAANLTLMQALLAPGGLGDMRMLLQSRGLPPLKLEDIFPPAEGWRGRRPPLLDSVPAEWQDLSSARQHAR